VGKVTNYKIYVELLWWIASIIVAGLIVLPIYTLFNVYPYLMFINVGSIVLTINLFRYIVAFKKSPLSNIRWLKKLFVFINIGIGMFMLNRYQYAKILLEEITPSTFGKLGNLFFSEIDSFFYFEKEFMFFIIGTLICLFVLELVLIRSIWKQDFAEEI